VTATRWLGRTSRRVISEKRNDSSLRPPLRAPDGGRFGKSAVTRCKGRKAALPAPYSFRGSFNLQLNASGQGHIGAHSAIWQNDALRNLWWNFWREHAPCHESWDPSTNTLHGCL